MTSWLRRCSSGLEFEGLRPFEEWIERPDVELVEQGGDVEYGWLIAQKPNKNEDLNKWLHGHNFQNIIDICFFDLYIYIYI